MRHVPRLRKVLLGLVDFGARSSDSDETRMLKRIWWVCMWFAVTTLWVWWRIVAALGLPRLAPFFLAQAVCWTTLTVIFAFLRSHIETIGFVSQTLLVVSGLVGVVYMGGMLHSSGVIFLGLIGPIYALAFPSRKRAVFLFAAFLLTVILAGAMEPWLEPREAITPAVNVALNAGALAIVSLFCYVALLYFVQQRDQALQLLRAEQQQSERLLLNILPKEVAETMKKDSRMIADEFEEASILFADVVNFTPLSADMPPVEVVGLLNEVFSAFDLLVEKYDLEKIKTIGDCYMVASGIPRRRPDHAHALLSMALELRDMVRDRTFHGERRLEIRIGVNSGSVVAGVIGRQKFSYDLWGDAVNTASRMESHGSAGRIQITRPTYDLVKDDFECVPQGRIDVKGKGEMEVWYVIDKRQIPTQGAPDV